ncbi:peptide-methionine (S)-S-oxide reductase [Hymenobacter gummosus]|uniref:Peptide methionine sulfoxide reductase MsrA n=1 Tax=Hymenobacter gummosus TaxID=1776032 RepID=A0A3S0H6F2_9BACT|nr:peptide-methionine (S)-S-oxide reductase MsrA [Hymenobacter gummosus]RTQ49654.1 peptide-methionine (S)-S-oxide reductase [Hymenobacter gummosus]
MKPLLILLLTALSTVGCEARSGGPGAAAPAATPPQDDRRFAELPKQQAGEAVATFASGCYWCSEHVFESLKGVRTVVSGYSGGTVANPTYEQVSHENTGHAESVQVYYDPKVISYATLVKVFFFQHDPTTLNRQGPDVGESYRSVVFYRTPQEKQQIDAEIKRIQAAKLFPSPVVTQVLPFKAFYPAERYHQDYFQNNPDNPYIRNVSTPRFQRFAEKFPELLKEPVK